MKVDVKSLIERDVRILTHYAAGNELKNIAVILGMTRDEVLGVVEELASFSRKQAGDLVTAYQRLQRKQQAKATPAPAADVPTEPAPDLAEATDGATELGEPDEPTDPLVVAEELLDEAVAAATALDATEPHLAYAMEVVDEPNIEDVLARAAAAGGRYAEQAARIREQIIALDADLAELARIVDLENRVAQLHAELDKATQELEAARARTGQPAGPAAQPVVGERPSDKVVRAWAKERGIEVNPVGTVRRDVVERYLAAMALQDIA